MRPKISKLIFFLIISILWAVSGSSAFAGRLQAPATIVVNGGGQAAVKNALAQAKPGDTVLVKAGNYDNNDPLVELKITVAGTAAAPITLLGENRPRLGTVEIENSQHFIIQGFEIADQSAGTQFFIGLKVKDSQHITIRDMLIHDLTASAISTSGTSSDILIEDSTIYELVPRETGRDAQCLVNSTARNVTFRNNECYGFIGDGYQAWRVDDTILYDRGTTIIEGNRIYNTKGPCSENAVDVKGESGTVIVRNNVMFGFTYMQESQCAVHASGCFACEAILFHEGSSGTALIEGNHLYDLARGIRLTTMAATIQNNLFVNIDESAIYDGNPTTKVYHNTFANMQGVFRSDKSNGAEVVNNLFFNAGETAAGNYSHNGWAGQNQIRAGAGDIVNNNLGLNDDYSLQAGSPLIDQGLDLGITSDFTGIPGVRPQGSAPDIGAFEFMGNSPIPTPTTTPPPTVEPSADSVTLAFNGPASVNPGQTFSLSVEAQGALGAGIYGVQFEVNYDPALISVSNLQVNPDLSFVLRSNVDDAAGKIRVVASREGEAPGLIGDVTLLTFDATAANAAGLATLTFENAKVSNPQAMGFDVLPQIYTITIGEAPTSVPTDEPTPAPTDEPTVEPTPDPTDEPTVEPTPEPTDDPTPEPTDEPTGEPTPDPTNEPTPEPTDDPTPEPTDEPTVEPTPEPTVEPTPDPTNEPTPEPTDEPTIAVFGQVILAGRANNNWADATVTLDNGGQLAAQIIGITDAGGNFVIPSVGPGTYSSVTADAAGYLPAVCTGPTLIGPEANLLPVTLLSGDIVDDKLVDVTDATAVGISFDQTGPDLPADINRDNVVDIFDLVLVSTNFGKSGPQEWVCQ